MGKNNIGKLRSTSLFAPLGSPSSNHSRCSADAVVSPMLSWVNREKKTLECTGKNRMLWKHPLEYKEQLQRFLLTVILCCFKQSTGARWADGVKGCPNTARHTAFLFPFSLLTVKHKTRTAPYFNSCFISSYSSLFYIENFGNLFWHHFGDPWFIFFITSSRLKHFYIFHGKISCKTEKHRKMNFLALEEMSHF